MNCVFFQLPLPPPSPLKPFFGGVDLQFYGLNLPKCGSFIWALGIYIYIYICIFIMKWGGGSSYFPPPINLENEFAACGVSKGVSPWILSARVFRGGQLLGSGSLGVYGGEKMSQRNIGMTQQTLFTFPPTIMEVENESFQY